MQKRTKKKLVFGCVYFVLRARAVASMMIVILLQCPERLLPRLSENFGTLLYVGPYSPQYPPSAWPARCLVRFPMPLVWLSHSRTVIALSAVSRTTFLRLRTFVQLFPGI